MVRKEAYVPLRRAESMHRTHQGGKVKGGMSKANSHFDI